MPMKEISERAAAALGGATAVVEHLMKTSSGKDPGARILWRSGLIQDNYRMGTMGCPAPIPDQDTAAEYLERLYKDGFFVVLRGRP